MTAPTNIDALVDKALRRLPPHVRDKFATDPHAALRDLGLTARHVDHLTDRRNDGGACDGVSFLHDNVILYAPTDHSRRENFTLAHELGHWVADFDDLLDWVADQDEPGRLLETICDRIASHLFLPRPLVVQTLAGQPLRAQHVLDLFNASHASIPACAIALADTLTHLGAIVLVDANTHIVHSSSVNPDPDQGWPRVFPWRDQPVPDGHPVKAMADGSHVARRAFWRTPWGAEQPYYMDALRQGRRIILVLSDTDIWGVERLHLDGPREFDQRPTGQVYCCGQSRQVTGWPCSTCGSHYCPSCGRCGCDRRAQREVQCTTCFLQYEARLVVNGVCVECRS